MQHLSHQRFPANLQSVGAVVLDIVSHLVRVAWGESESESGQQQKGNVGLALEASPPILSKITFPIRRRKEP